MPYVKILDKNIYYREYGSGEPIVFLNGMMMSTSSWTPFAKIVSKDYKMITVDLLDQGRSDSCEDKYTIDTQGEFLNQFLGELNLKKSSYIGNFIWWESSFNFCHKAPYNGKVFNTLQYR